MTSYEKEIIESIPAIKDLFNTPLFIHTICSMWERYNMSDNFTKITNTATLRGNTQTIMSKYGAVVNDYELFRRFLVELARGYLHKYEQENKKDVSEHQVLTLQESIYHAIIARYSFVDKLPLTKALILRAFDAFFNKEFNLQDVHLYGLLLEPYASCAQDDCEYEFASKSLLSFFTALSIRKSLSENPSNHSLVESLQRCKTDRNNWLCLKILSGMAHCDHVDAQMRSEKEEGAKNFKLQFLKAMLCSASDTVDLGTGELTELLMYLLMQNDTLMGYIINSEDENYSTNNNSKKEIALTKKIEKFIDTSIGNKLHTWHDVIMSSGYLSPGLLRMVRHLMKGGENININDQLQALELLQRMKTHPLVNTPSVIKNVMSTSLNMIKEAKSANAMLVSIHILNGYLKEGGMSLRDKKQFLESLKPITSHGNRKIASLATSIREKRCEERCEDDKSQYPRLKISKSFGNTSCRDLDTQHVQFGLTSNDDLLPKGKREQLKDTIEACIQAVAETMNQENYVDEMWKLIKKEGERAKSISEIDNVAISEEEEDNDVEDENEEENINLVSTWHEQNQTENSRISHIMASCKLLLDFCKESKHEEIIRYLNFLKEMDDEESYLCMEAYLSCLYKFENEASKAFLPSSKHDLFCVLSTISSFRWHFIETDEITQFFDNIGEALKRITSSIEEEKELEDFISGIKDRFDILVHNGPDSRKALKNLYHFVLKSLNGTVISNPIKDFIIDCIKVAEFTTTFSKEDNKKGKIIFEGASHHFDIKFVARLLLDVLYIQAKSGNELPLNIQFSRDVYNILPPDGVKTSAFLYDVESIITRIITREKTTREKTTREKTTEEKTTEEKTTEEKTTEEKTTGEKTTGEKIGLWDSRMTLIIERDIYFNVIRSFILVEKRTPFGECSYTIVRIPEDQSADDSKSAPETPYGTRRYGKLSKAMLLLVILVHLHMKLILCILMM